MSHNFETIDKMNNFTGRVCGAVITVCARGGRFGGGGGPGTGTTLEIVEAELRKPSSELNVVTGAGRFRPKVRAAEPPARIVID